MASLNEINRNTDAKPKKAPTKLRHLLASVDQFYKEGGEPIQTVVRYRSLWPAYGQSEHAFVLIQFLPAVGQPENMTFDLEQEVTYNEDFTQVMLRPQGCLSKVTFNINLVDFEEIANPYLDQDTVLNEAYKKVEYHTLLRKLDGPGSTEYMLGVAGTTTEGKLVQISKALNMLGAEHQVSVTEGGVTTDTMFADLEQAIWFYLMKTKEVFGS